MIEITKDFFCQCIIISLEGLNIDLKDNVDTTTEVQDVLNHDMSKPNPIIGKEKVCSWFIESEIIKIFYNNADRVVDR